MIEPQAGVFVGRLSALVRDKVWDRTVKGVRTGGAIMLYRTNNEQGFAIRTSGQTRRQIQDFDGLLLVKRPLKG